MADALAEDANVLQTKGEQVAEFVPTDERGLRRGADIQPLVFVDPGDRAVRLQVRVLATVRRVRTFVDGIRPGKTSFDVADTTVDFDQDVALRVANESVHALVMDGRSAGSHRLLGIEDGRQDLVLDRDLAAPFLGGGL